MKDAYEKKFDLEFKVFHNYADSKNLPLASVDGFKFNAQNPFKILFLGSLFSHLHNGAINDICNAVKEIEKAPIPLFLISTVKECPTDFLSVEIDGWQSVIMANRSSE